MADLALMQKTGNHGEREEPHVPKLPVFQRDLTRQAHAYY